MIAPPEKAPFARSARREDYLQDAAGLWADIPSFTAFSQEVHDALLADELLFDERQKLIRRAEQLGIRPFDANLIIAMVQNRMQAGVSNSSRSQRTLSPIVLIITFCAMQSLILLGAWWVLH
jgi:hypothetical protein